MSALTMIGILTVSLLAGGTDAITTSVMAASAQVSTLGEPFLVEKGKITSQKEIGPTERNSPFLPRMTVLILIFP